MSPPSNDGAPKQVPKTAAIRGLCCDVCSLFIGSHEDPARVAA